MTKASAKVNERIEDLTKEELVEVINQLGALWLFNRSIIPGIIRAAKAKVMRKRADAAFTQWEQLSELCQQLPKETFDQQLAWFQKHHEANKFFKKWDRLWKRADELEFGPRKKESANAAK